MGKADVVISANWSPDGAAAIAFSAHDEAVQLRHCSGDWYPTTADLAMPRGWDWEATNG